jgi:outer membrane receptor protein involved in Fe transport
VLGGVVNFGMRKAARSAAPGDGDQSLVPKFELVTQAGYNNLKSTYSDYKFVGSAEKRFFGEGFGVFLQGSAERRNLSANELSADYFLYAKDYGDAGIPELNSVKLIDVLRTRERVGGTLVLDYQHETGEIGLMSTLSSSRTMVMRSEEELRWRSRDIFFYVEDTDTRLGTLSNILSIKQDVGLFRIDLKASHNYSENDNPGALRIDFWQRAYSGFDNRGNLAFVSPQTLASYATPWSTGTVLAYMSLTDELTKERTFNTALNLETTAPISSELSGRLKFGGAYMYRTRSYDIQGNSGVEYFRGAPEFVLDQNPSWESATNPGTIGLWPFLTDVYQSRSFFNGEYPYPLTLTSSPIKPYLAGITSYNPESRNTQNQIQNRFNDYSGNERKISAYAMFTLNIGDNIKILPGVRYQNLTTTYEAWRGRLLPNNTIQGNDTTVTQSHGYFLPMVHARYQPLEWFQIHFAYTNTLNYPDYSTVTPRYIIAPSTVYYNNWRVKPARSENFDLVLAFHSNEIGLLSINGFKKRITDLIFYSKT